MQMTVISLYHRRKMTLDVSERNNTQGVYVVSHTCSKRVKITERYVRGITYGRPVSNHQETINSWSGSLQPSTERFTGSSNENFLISGASIPLLVTFLLFGLRVRIIR